MKKRNNGDSNQLTKSKYDIEARTKPRRMEIIVLYHLSL
ncbi:uncharacterized protein G2W53_028701 [Senna tora]|uniref:Uncharacterized protein n=1 Tax=Senna tora TaxID=362788 RepID=A0A834W9Y6_9FABA|nr:uncharacterized protein G2W53_028701 [Senna tora]